MVDSESAGLVPVAGSIRKISVNEKLSAESNAETEGDYRIYLSLRAMLTISDHIGWGQDTDQNQVEQGGILVGSVVRDEESGSVCGIAREAIPGVLAEGSMAYLKFGHGAWKGMLDVLDELNDLDDTSLLHLIGWYHTHPRHLSVFMSGTDRATQRRMFAEDWLFAIVLNPQKRVWRAYHGPDTKECHGYVIADDKT